MNFPEKPFQSPPPPLYDGCISPFPCNTAPNAPQSFYTLPTEWWKFFSRCYCDSYFLPTCAQHHSSGLFLFVCLTMFISSSVNCLFAVLSVFLLDSISPFKHQGYLSFIIIMCDKHFGYNLWSILPEKKINFCVVNFIVKCQYFSLFLHFLFCL